MLSDYFGGANVRRTSSIQESLRDVNKALDWWERFGENDEYFLSYAYRGFVRTGLRREFAYEFAYSICF